MNIMKHQRNAGIIFFISIWFSYKGIDACNSSAGSTCNEEKCDIGWMNPPLCQTLSPVFSSPPSITDVGTNSITITFEHWSTTRDIGDHPVIVGYKLLMEPQIIRLWHIVRRITDLTMPGNTTIHIGNLSSNAIYRFRYVIICLEGDKAVDSIPTSPISDYVKTKPIPCIYGPTGHTANTSDILLINRTEASLSIEWKIYETSRHMYYMVKAVLLQSYSGPPYSAETLLEFATYLNATMLHGLQSASLYSIRITAIVEEQQHNHAYGLIWTDIPFPPTPQRPLLVDETNGTSIVIEIYPSVNENMRTISKYDIIVEIVSNGNSTIEKVRREELCLDLYNYHDATRMEMQWYITYSIPAENVQSRENITIGDGETYDGFYNRQLEMDVNYKLWLSTAVALNGITKHSYIAITDIVHSTDTPLISIIVTGSNGDTGRNYTAILIIILIATFLVLQALLIRLLIKLYIESQRADYIGNTSDRGVQTDQHGQIFVSMEHLGESDDKYQFGDTEHNFNLAT